MISNEVFVSYLNCRRKAFFKQAGQVGEMAQIEQVQMQLDKTHAGDALDWFLSQEREGDVLRDPTTLETAIQSRSRCIVAAIAQAGNLCSRVDLLERQDDGQAKAALYGPVLFVRNSKVTKNDRFLLAFQALALSLVQGTVPVTGRIVCGSEHRVVRVRLASLVEEVRRIVAPIEADSRCEGAPTLTLNRHCAACEFRKGCLTLAEQIDDLSLLRCLSEKEVLQQRRRGVTTLTQFSHSYRPGRRGKRRAGKARKHDCALQALALREKKVYVMDAPSLVHSEVALYLDVEGVPDLDFYYLIGLLAVERDRSTFYCFWAEDMSRERAAWDACAQLIGTFSDYTLYHYGQYERRFLERMKKRGNEEGAAAIDGILGRSCNLLSAIYSHIYFPTRCNGLKDVAGLLGFRWSAEGASGLQALAWRLMWESGKEESLKHKLLQYNREDCMALKRVTEFVLSVCAGPSPGFAEVGPPVAQADDLKGLGPFRFGKIKFFCPELEHINKCAYSNYQREKVYVRTSPAVRSSQKRKLCEGKRRLKVNQEVEYPQPEKCPECGGARVRDLAREPYHKLLLDLKYTRSGVKRWVVRTNSRRYQCRDCKATFYADLYRTTKSQFGHNLSAWAVYQHVALRQSYNDVTDGLNDLFGFSFSYGVLKHIKPDMANLYRGAYEALKNKLRRGVLAHADETKANVKGHSRYVWAFSNLEEVVYVYTPTRDGDILEEVLEGFTGVLVSDFYTAYDSVKCPQQKCLIHLMRDLNNDLFHSPFDEELKGVAQRFVGLLKPIIDTIDTHGLKGRHLHKHKKDAEGFLRYLDEHQFQSELARHYQKRVGKYRDRLFTFLDHDGVPWNNNNAEVAVKQFASRRKVMGASFTEKGLQDYLVFLSIYQTCRNKHVSFLRFLRSGSFDLDAFIGSQRSR